MRRRTKTDLDVETLNKMAFVFNWKASFDFPYMGMFLPPVKYEEDGDLARVNLFEVSGGWAIPINPSAAL